MTASTKSRSARDAWAAIGWFGVECRLALTTFRGPDAARARLARLRTTDCTLMVLAVLLPWTTTGALGALITCFALLVLTVPLAMWPTTIARPACALTLALFLLCLLGTAWASGATRADTVHAIGQVYKLTMIGLLLAHFQDSRRASWVFTAFVASNAVLLVYSYIVYVAPELALVNKPDQPGVPIRNYIDQSQAFALCAVGLLGVAGTAWQRGQRRAAGWLGALALAFLLNLAFVNVARTALVYLPVMLLVLLGRFLSGRRFALAVVALAVAALAVGAASPNLQSKFERIFSETAQYGAPVGSEGPASAATRLEYWHKSLGFVRAAPLIGHGTGTTRALFARDAEGKSDLEALITANPHNQTLAVALQWGLVGVALLWAMWAVHLWLFRGPGLYAFIGLLAVTQNLIGSLFNSHLFDFYEGWIYVLAVGVAGGMVLRERGEAKEQLAPSP
jgi:O-antigen ligase